MRPARPPWPRYTDSSRASYRGAAVRAVANMPLSTHAADWKQWARYGRSPNCRIPICQVWVVCKYSANGRPDTVLEDAVAIPIQRCSADGWQASERFEDPGSMVRKLTPEGRDPQDLRSFSTGDDLEVLRRGLRARWQARR